VPGRAVRGRCLVVRRHLHLISLRFHQSLYDHFEKTRARRLSVSPASNWPTIQACHVVWIRKRWHLSLARTGYDELTTFFFLHKCTSPYPGHSPRVGNKRFIQSKFKVLTRRPSEVSSLFHSFILTSWIQIKCAGND
jgi:hypothetical protein